MAEKSDIALLFDLLGSDHEVPDAIYDNPSEIECHRIRQEDKCPLFDVSSLWNIEESSLVFRQFFLSGDCVPTNMGHDTHWNCMNGERCELVNFMVNERVSECYNCKA